MSKKKFPFWDSNPGSWLKLATFFKKITFESTNLIVKIIWYICPEFNIELDPRSCIPFS